MRKILFSIVLVLSFLAFPSFQVNVNTPAAQTGCIQGRDVPIRQFAADVLQGLGYPTTTYAIDAFQVWAPHENTRACWNPLATTYNMPGDLDTCFNSVCVRNYPDYATGVQATINTLNLSYYTNVRKFLSGTAFDKAALTTDMGHWTGTSGYGSVLVNEWEPIWNNRTSLDLVFLIDTTGSMGDDIFFVKLFAGGIVDTIKAAAPSARLAVMDFRDFPERTAYTPDYPYRDALAFTDNGNSTKDAINGLTLGYGGDWAETRLCALMHALKNDRCAGKGASTNIGGWRLGPARRIIVLTDAPALDPEPFTNFTRSQVIQAAVERGVVVPSLVSALAARAQDETPPDGFELGGVAIYSVVVGGDPSTLDDSQAIADGTGGKVFTAATADEVVDAILEAIRDITTPPAPAPTCETSSPNPGLLWPPNDKFRTVQIQGVENADSVVITSIFQDEPTGGEVDGSGLGTNTTELRAQRLGKGDGRVYHINFTATGLGGSCSSEVQVIVPHDMGTGQRERGTAGDGGQQYDSLIP